MPGTTSAYAERITGGYYLDISPRRDQLARYGVAVGELQDVIATALGGEMVTTTVEGRERFSVNVRCLDRATIESVNVRLFDGQHWERSAAELAASAREAADTGTP